MENLPFSPLAVALIAAEIVEGSGDVLSPGFSGRDGDDGCFSPPCRPPPNDQSTSSSGGRPNTVIAVIFFTVPFLAFFLWCMLSKMCASAGYTGKLGRVAPITTAADAPAAPPSIAPSPAAAPDSTPTIEIIMNEATRYWALGWTGTMATHATSVPNFIVPEDYYA